MSGLFGLSGDAKSRLMTGLSTRKAEHQAFEGDSPRDSAPALGNAEMQANIDMMRRAAATLGLENPYFQSHDTIAGARTRIGSRDYDNFVSYNYLGLNGDYRVSLAAKEAIDRYGTSVSGSRLVSGERPFHRVLEEALADVYGAEDALAFVSGHATNVTVIGHLVGAGDAVVHDALCHNSVLQGAVLSGARRSPFPHNDAAGLDLLLSQIRSTVKRVLVVVEGHYSMDGDVPDLPALIRVARRHRASLMVDEAHSLGVLGTTGLGIAEHCGVDPRDIDVWMGTLSKTLSSCGGYIAGSRALIDHLRYSAPGFVYSVGLAPPVAAASLEALKVMRAEPERIATLTDNANFFLSQAKAAGLDTGPSIGAAIVPVMTGGSIRTAMATDALRRQGVAVQPIMQPAVPEQSSRLRFFVSSLHNRTQIARVVAQTANALVESGRKRVNLIELAAKLTRS